MLIDAAGMLGVVMILVTYSLVQLDRMDIKSVSYSVFNALGACLILVSLLVDFNLSAFIIEICWLLISIFGIYSSIRKKQQLQTIPDHDPDGTT